MSHSFKSYPAKPCFAQFKEPTNAGDYISKKKKSAFCVYNCQSNEINKNQLYINLITKLQLNSDIPVIVNNSNGLAPSSIDPTQNPTIKYTIDPDGILFGNNICTINNWQNYVVYNKPN